MGSAGAVAGPKGCVVKLQDAVKKPWPDATFPLSPEFAAATDELRATA